MAKRLSDDEKKTLLAFYQENPPLWDGTNPYYKSKEMREQYKSKLVEQFDNLYSVEQLDKSFLSLSLKNHKMRTSFLHFLFYTWLDHNFFQARETQQMLRCKRLKSV